VAAAAPEESPGSCEDGEELLQPARASAVTDTSDQITLRIVKPHQAI
jgi:hypothetical protein